MIIELLGPPAAGKTTLAPAIVSALRKNGFDVQLVTSSRPREQPHSQREVSGILTSAISVLSAPLTRAAKLIGAFGALLSGSDHDQPSLKLLERLPPRSPIWSIRYRRYLNLLGQSWDEAQNSNRVVVFDQGFLQALCSLCLLTRSVDQKTLALGFNSLPASDLVVYLDTPLEVLEARLRRRVRSTGALERFFEQDLHTSLKQIQIDQHVIRLLKEKDRPVTHVSCVDQEMLGDAADEVLKCVIQLRGLARSHTGSREAHT